MLPISRGLSKKIELIIGRKAILPLLFSVVILSSYSLRHISIIFPSSALQEIIALITTRARNSAHIKSVRERFINAITVFKRKRL